MKLKDAIDLYVGKHGGEKSAEDKQSFELMLTQLEDEQGEVAEPSEIELDEEVAAAEAEGKSERKLPKMRFTHRRDRKRESPVLHALASRRATLIRMALAGAILLCCNIITIPDSAILAAKIAAGIIIGYDLVLKAVSDIMRLSFVGGALAVLIAAIMYICIGRGTEAVITLIVYQAAVLSADFACEKIHKTCRKSFEAKLSEDVVEGAILDLGEGMTCPADCVVVAGSGSADMSCITGDRTAVALSAESFVPAGVTIVRGIMTAKVVSIAENSLINVISRGLLSGTHEKTRASEKAMKASKYLVLGVLFVAAFLAVVLPTVLKLSVSDALSRVACVIAVATPGSLLLAVPLTFFVGMSAARRIGVVFKKATDMENCAVVKSVVFDKAGCLTGREYVVSDIATDKMDPATFLKVAAYAVNGSDSSIARAIVAAYGQSISDSLIENRMIYEGRGVSASVDGIQILLGTQGFLAEQGISLPRLTNDFLAMHMTVNGIYAGRIVLSDYIMPTANTTINRLSSLGVERFTMMSTDNRERDLSISKELGIDEYLAECPLSERPRRVKEIKARIDPKCTLAFVSANLEAKECFASADVGVAVDGLSQPRLLELADVTVMSPEPDNIATALQISQGVSRFTKYELLFTIAAKLVLLLLAGFGFLPLWLIVLLDAIASLGVLLDTHSALRLGGSIGYGSLLK